jgi:hypothetical protein
MILMPVGGLQSHTMGSHARSSLEQARILMGTTVTGTTGEMRAFGKNTIDHPGTGVARSRFHE